MLRVLMIASVVFFVLALICNQVPTQVLSINGTGWLILGFLAWAVDVLLGGWVVAGPARRPPPAA